MTDEAKPKQDWLTVGENVQYQMQGNRLFLCIDMTHVGPPTTGTKGNVRVASTLGNNLRVPTADGRVLSAGFNMYGPPPAPPAKAK